MNAAVITETRTKRNINDIIHDHLSYLPDDYELVIFCSEENKHLFKEFNCKKYIVRVHSLATYNVLMTSSYYWDKLIHYERVLIIQWESRILRKGIEKFYKYDYVGAPWKFQERGGNGGLSLRNPKVMKETILKVPYSISLGYEDVYFCNQMKGKLAPRSICKTFSCETIFELNTFGFHAIQNYLSSDECEQIKNQYKKYHGSLLS